MVKKGKAMLMARCVIVGGADIKNYDRIKNIFRDDDEFVFCDSGLKHEDALNVHPLLIVGDFDSFDKPERGEEIIVLPCEKDDTDTFFAAKTALERGYTEFLLIGVIGGRLDHTLANVSLLLYLFDNGAIGEIYDDYSRMCIVGKSKVKVSKDAKFFSLNNCDGDAHGVNIENAKYQLKDATVTSSYTYSVSNELLDGLEATVNVEKGRMLLVEVL